MNGINEVLKNQILQNIFNCYSFRQFEIKFSFEMSPNRICFRCSLIPTKKTNENVKNKSIVDVIKTNIY